MSCTSEQIKSNLFNYLAEDKESSCCI